MQAPPHISELKKNRWPLRTFRRFADGKSMLAVQTEVPDFVSNKCCRSLKTQLVVKDLAQLQVMPLVAEEDVVPAWLLDRKEESRQKAAAWSLVL